MSTDATCSEFSPIISTDGHSTIDAGSTMNLENLEITPMVAVSNDETATGAMEALLSSMPSPPMSAQAWPSDQIQEEYQEEVKDDVKMQDAQPQIKSNGKISFPCKDFSIGTSALASKSGMVGSSSSNSLNALAISRSTSSDALSRSLSGNSLSGLGTSPVARRQRRLERNRESARLSRRRRKQYLEVLEEKVAALGEQMDFGRRNHVFSAMGTINALRDRLLNMVENEFHQGKQQKLDPSVMNFQESRIRALFGPLHPTCDELQIATDFQREQLRCLSLPSHSKFVLWLTLQNDAYFRGGRAASERLSAARIGEKLLLSGNTDASPTNGMWPLFCNEVGLSYDQEDKIRVLQRAMLSNSNVWLERRTCKASECVLLSSNKCINGISQGIRCRTSNFTKSLSNEQIMKFLMWSKKNKERIISLCSKKSPSLGAIGLSPENHVATNLVLLDRQLQAIKANFPNASSLIPRSLLKTFRRRPTFESLGGTQKDMTPSTSTSSLSSLKKVNSTCVIRERSSSIVSFQENMSETVPSLSPEEAQLAAKDEVIRILGIESVEATSALSLNEPNRLLDVASMDIDPIPVIVKSAEVLTVRGSFLEPSSLQVDTSENQDDDILFNLTDEDWAIGFDLET